MEAVLSSDEMKNIDSLTSTKYGIDSFTLMERAALECAKFILSNFGKCKVGIFAGTGNNGGDGIALARILWEYDFEPELFIVGNTEHQSLLSKKQIEIISNYPIKVSYTYETNNDFDVIVDAMFGIGLNREITGIYRDAIEYINNKSGKKIALDIPSGINADNGNVMGCAIKADYTITFGAKKKGQIYYPGRTYCGNLICTQIGIPTRLFTDYSTYILNRENFELKTRKPDGNKGTFGKILIIAGSEKMGGAAILAAKAALHSGAGMVKVYTHRINRDLILNAVPEAMVDTYESDDFLTLKENIDWSDAVVIGPGLSTDSKTQILVEKTVCLSDKLTIYDADALNILSNRSDLIETLKTKSFPVIFTPHIGEFSRLTNISISEIKAEFESICKQYATKNNIILVCKDACTLVTNGNKAFLNTSGNDGMATAGSGDVLSGIIAAISVYEKEELISVAKGVFVHGVAADIAKDKTSAYYIIAEDIINELPNILKA